MIGEVAVLALSDIISQLGLMIQWKSFCKVEEGIQQWRNGFMVGEMRIGEEGRSGELGKIRASSSGTRDVYGGNSVL